MRNRHGDSDLKFFKRMLIGYPLVLLVMGLFIAIGAAVISIIALAFKYAWPLAIVMIIGIIKWALGGFE